MGQVDYGGIIFSQCFQLVYQFYQCFEGHIPANGIHKNNISFDQVKGAEQYIGLLIGFQFV
jgi:hypothetical protein